MKADREYFLPARRSIAAKVEGERVTEVFSLILLLYYHRKGIILLVYD